MQRKRFFRGAILTAALLCCAPICAACARAAQGNASVAAHRGQSRYGCEDEKLQLLPRQCLSRRRSRQCLQLRTGPLYAALCGHNDGYCTREDRIETEHGTHTVQTLLRNMQHNEARRGTVQILTIDPVAETLSLYAYTPVFENMLPRETQLPIELVTPAP